MHDRDHALLFCVLGKCSIAPWSVYSRNEKKIMYVKKDWKN